MHDIFLSYAREDLERVLPLIRALEQYGWRVWWDRTLIPGQRFSHVIEEALDASGCVIVVWSEAARQSYWVEVEAGEGLRRGVLVPAKIETDIRIPLGFRAIQTADLVDWQGDTSHPEYVRVVQAVTSHIGEPAVRITEPAGETASPEPVEERPSPESRWTNSIGIEFALIQPGEFIMGSNNGRDNEKPPHRVRISQPFYMGVTPVTQVQWEIVMESNPSHFKGDSQRPVESVSWNDVQKFIAKLKEHEPGFTYRLPSEAEWEYAARAGSTTNYCYGDDEARLGEYAWYEVNSGGTTHPVAQLKPNAWNLYDVHGNVWEWIYDWYANYSIATADATATSAVVDPDGPESGSNRVIRGGSWGHGARDCRSAYRVIGVPGYAYHDRGFRLLRQL